MTVGAVPSPPTQASPVTEAGPDDGTPPVFHRPRHIRGLYLNAWVAGSRVRSRELIELARRTEVNTFVIDVKDESGYVSYPTSVELAREIGADRELRIRNLERLLRELHEAGIYPIARIVIAKDPILAQARPDLAVQDSTGAPWVDGKGDVWLNPWQEEVWSYHIDLAREAAELGFPEIQWDYVRFPDRPAEEMDAAVFPGAEGRARTLAVRSFLERSRAELGALGIPVTADVFGVVTTFRRDVGVGQIWEDVVDVVDAVLPMVYPSHYWPGSFGLEAPNAHPYEVVSRAMRDAVRRTEAVEGAGRIIPWLQSFTLGPPRYGAPEIRAQILATYDRGIREWILWNASGRYVEEALEPVGGWARGEEPPIRLAGRLVPPALRFFVLAGARPTPVEEEGIPVEDADAEPASGDPSGPGEPPGGR